mgnify:CR=1 FL=1
MNQLKLIFFLLFGLFFSACSIVSSDSNSSQIVGQWEWFRSAGGFIGEIITTDSAGVSTRHITFKSNFKFSFFRADTVVVSGKYSISKKNGETVISYDTEKKFFFDQRVRFKGNDTLILADECADCYINYYKRDK